MLQGLVRTGESLGAFALLVGFGELEGELEDGTLRLRGQAAQSLRGDLLLVDVGTADDVAREISPGTAKRDHGGQEPAILTVGAALTNFRFPKVAGGGVDGAFPVDAVNVVRVDKPRPAIAEDLLELASGEMEGGVILKNARAVRVGHPYEIG